MAIIFSKALKALRVYLLLLLLCAMSSTAWGANYQYTYIVINLSGEIATQAKATQAESGTPVIPDVINSFNNGTFADRYQRANAAMAGAAIEIAGGTDISMLEKDVAAIRRQGDELRSVDGQGNTVIRYKNLTRKIYKN